MKRNNFLLPAGFKFAGLFFTLIGAFLAYLRFYLGMKPHVLDGQPYAVYSSYLETKSMQFIHNNMSEEIVCLFLFLGLFFIAFSRNRVEDETIISIRTRAFFLTAYIEVLFVLFSIFFTYGFAFAYMAMANLFFPLLSYILTFYILMAINHWHQNKLKASGNEQD